MSNKVKRPWRTQPWPKILADGKTKRYVMAYRDHEGVTRSAGASFRSIKASNDWADAYEDATRYGRLREFLLGPDKLRDPRVDMTLGEMMADWLAIDADPLVDGGLGAATFESFKAIANKHIIGNELRDRKDARKVTRARVDYAIGDELVTSFNDGGVISVWLDGMRKAKVSASVQQRAWAVLSSALDWAVRRGDYPLSVNGCKTLTRKRTERRASRRKSNTAARVRAARRAAPANWALSPEAVQRIRWIIVHDPQFAGRREIDRWRDATIVQMQYDLGDRNQETLGPRWADYDLVAGELVHADVVSMDGLGEGKVSGATRRTPIPPTAVAVLADWRKRAAAAGIPTGGSDFVIPGSADAGHFTSAQSKRLGQKFFRPAAGLVADAHPHLADIRGATLYALRRGSISLRLRAGDAADKVAEDCGTSEQMLGAHYKFALEAFKADGPIDADAERQVAFDLVWGRGTARAHLRAV